MKGKVNIKLYDSGYKKSRRKNKHWFEIPEYLRLLIIKRKRKKRLNDLFGPPIYRSQEEIDLLQQEFLSN